ncbi:hypothetical protein [Pseudoduganella violacea]|uniref:Uncharacterized protein n=1 Tax=Pseudoduganella violacea TaxID=1715466 RepID=A0A7W5B882_9BURK|nr:hypothetical protein [Pseudoduganella violacea]MBB3118367.1 hypothetical protein [Pseudoduganella violacea]
MKDQELTTAALRWHAVHVRRLAAGKEKRKLDTQLKANGISAFSRLHAQQSETALQLTTLKRKELAALRALAKACAKQRGHLLDADVIELDGTTFLLPAAA